MEVNELQEIVNEEIPPLLYSVAIIWDLLTEQIYIVGKLLFVYPNLLFIDSRFQVILLLNILVQNNWLWKNSY